MVFCAIVENNPRRALARSGLISTIAHKMPLINWLKPWLNCLNIEIV